MRTPEQIAYEKRAKALSLRSYAKPTSVQQIQLAPKCKIITPSADYIRESGGRIVRKNR